MCDGCPCLKYDSAPGSLQLLSPLSPKLLSLVSPQVSPALSALAFARTLGSDSK